jgi:hypothetical protein
MFVRFRAPLETHELRLHQQAFTMPRPHFPAAALALIHPPTASVPRAPPFQTIPVGEAQSSPPFFFSPLGVGPRPKRLRFRQLRRSIH